MDNPADTDHFTRSSCRCNDNIKIDIEEMGFYDVTGTDPGQGHVSCLCDGLHEPYLFHNREFPPQLDNLPILKMMITILIRIMTMMRW
jgi:hypothetical protein